MRFLHISDLHLGLRLYEASLIDDQKYILEKIIEICEKRKISAVVIAGDIYDKSIPSAEAVALFDSFLSTLMQKKIYVLSVAGNHDSGGRLSFGSRIMEKSGIFIEGVYEGKIKKAVLEDKFGKINFYLLPFIKPSAIRAFFEDKKAESYTDALKAVIENESINKDERNVMVSHQFVTGAGIDVERSESETVFVGGTENVDISCYKDFDYVALGHIHKRQNVRENIVYCGTPLKYSFSEARQTKCAVMVEMREKGEIYTEDIVLEPLRDMRCVEGFLKDIAQNAVNQEDYIYAVLKDENIINAMEKLREIYPNALRLEFGRGNLDIYDDRREGFKELSVTELFEKFYVRQNGESLSENGRKAAEEIYGRTGGEENETS